MRLVIASPTQRPPTHRHLSSTGDAARTQVHPDHRRVRRHARTRLRPGDVEAVLAVRDGLCNPFGIVHGGVYSSLAETIATPATIYRVHQHGHAAIAMGNDTRLLRPISEGHIHARARTLHTGRSTWLWDVEFHDDHDRLCATSRVTLAIVTYTDTLS